MDVRLIIEVEYQPEKTIKIVRSAHGGEYYERCDDTNQLMGTFSNLRQDYEIFAQYTMPNTREQNGVAERRNKTLMEMVRSIMSTCVLPE